MAGLVPAIHAFLPTSKAWMPATSAGMTLVASMPPAAVSSAATAPLVTLAGVAKHFANGTLALDRFDLAIRNGEFLSLLGPSGLVPQRPKPRNAELGSAR